MKSPRNTRKDTKAKALDARVECLLVRIGKLRSVDCEQLLYAIIGMCQGGLEVNPRLGLGKFFEGIEQVLPAFERRQADTEQLGSVPSVVKNSGEVVA